MAKIYLPINNVSDYQCYVVQDKDTIRAYSQRPQQNTIVNYDDFYVNSHYIKRNGTQTFGQYSTLPTCISSSEITTDYLYSNDLPFVCIELFFILFVMFIPYKICSRMFGRWLKC